MRKLLRFIGFFVPHFVTEDVVFNHSKDAEGKPVEVLVCAMHNVRQGEKFDGVVEVRAFTFMFWGYSLRETNIRPFVNPCDDAA